MKYSLILCSDMHMDIDKANFLFEVNPCVEWVADFKKADIVIIMTCAFGTKKRYSMFVIADVIKSSKPNAQIIATGCLAKLNEAELKAIPRLEVKSFEEVAKMLKQEPNCNKNECEVCKIPQDTVIISNGCLKKCSYCVYPLLEQTYTSKPIEQILSEVEVLYQKVPIIYISGAHETSDYGVDLYRRRAFPKLLEQICTRFPKQKYVIGWFHPDGLTDETIDMLREYKNIVQIMVHIQHIDNSLLASMNRPKFEKTEARIQKLHALRPDLSISTELIVGFPGETEESFNHLVQYLETNRNVFTDIGVASYEPVVNTKATQLPNLPSMEIRKHRMEIIKAKFGATTYEAPKDFEPLLSSFLEACYLLDKYANKM